MSEGGETIPVGVTRLEEDTKTSIPIGSQSGHGEYTVVNLLRRAYG